MHSWDHARMPSYAVTTPLRRHHVVMSGHFEHDGPMSYWFANQGDLDPSEYLAFYYLPVTLHRCVARQGPLEGPRIAAT
eukprot:3973427-Alexandrium_andersonii.AAC.1